MRHLVDVIRAEYKSTLLEVEADSRESAVEEAYNQATNIDWTDMSSYDTVYDTLYDMEVDEND